MRKSLLLATAIALMTCLIYLPAAENGFLNWDDDSYVTENQNLRLGFWDFIERAFTGFYLSNYIPLTMLSYGADYALWGLNPLGYHLTNIVLHGLNTFLVILISLRLFEKAYLQGKDALIAASMVGLLFGIHPLHVESAAWVSERKDLLYAFFFLLSAMAYISYTEVKKASYYILSLMFFVLSLLSKPMAVTLPVILLVLDYYPLRRRESAHRVLVEKVPFFALSVFCGIVAVIAQKTGGAMIPFRELNIYERLMMSLKAPWFYILKTIAPLNLSPLYPIPEKMQWFSFEYIFFAALTACITGVAISLRSKNPPALSSWAYFIVSLAPTLSIAQVGNQAAADRYMYLPVLGLFAPAAALIIKLMANKKMRGFLIASVLSLSVILSALTVRQIGIWRDSLTFWSYAIEKHPESAIPYRHRADALAGMKDYSSAVRDYTKAISLEPAYIDAYNNRGAVYSIGGRYREAVGDFTKALFLGTGDNKVLYYNRALNYEALGEGDLAMKDYRASARLGYEPAGQRLGQESVR